jgi:hypothetical protein
MRLGLRVRLRCKGANQNNAPGTPLFYIQFVSFQRPLGATCGPAKTERMTRPVNLGTQTGPCRIQG